MPKRSSDDLNARILGELARYPSGTAIEPLTKALYGVSRRTLQRRLKELAEDNALLAEGERKGRVYRLPRIDAPLDDVAIPISREGESIRRYIAQPIQKRKPTSYNRAFLAKYRPNKTFYLSPAMLARLEEVGATSGGSLRAAGTYARDIANRLLIDLSWASSRLEGNTYSRLDTKDLIEVGQQATGKDQLEAQMILNHKAAIETLIENAETIGFNRFTFLNIHALLSENLLADRQESGRIRRRNVDITGTVFHPLGIPQQLEECFDELLEKAEGIQNAFEQAFFIMVHVPYLQPFIDVNKRVSRLGANVSLIKHNLRPLSFVDVPEKLYVDGTLGVYELEKFELLRDVFVWAYQRSCERYAAIQPVMAEPDPLRLRYHDVFATIVGDIVRSNEPARKNNIVTRAQGLVLDDDLERFVTLALDDLKNLHEGNVSRYRLRLSEFADWKRRS